MTEGNHHSLFLRLKNGRTSLLGWYLGARHRHPRRHDYENSSLSDVKPFKKRPFSFPLQADLISTLGSARSFKTDGEQGQSQLYECIIFTSLRLGGLFC